MIHRQTKYNIRHLKTYDAIAAVTEDDWVSSCRHVEEVERKYWDADIAVEAEMEKIVIKNTIVKTFKM